MISIAKLATIAAIIFSVALIAQATARINESIAKKHSKDPCAAYDRSSSHIHRKDLGEPTYNYGQPILLVVECK